MSLKIPNRSSRIVCNSPRWNLLGQVGGAPGVDVLGSVTLGAFNMPTESGVVSHVFSGAIVGMRMAPILQFVIATATGRLDETHVFSVSKRIACVGYEVH
jgi:hypothetical protein